MASNLVNVDSLNDLSRMPIFGRLDDFFKDVTMWPAVRGMADSRIKMDVTETEKSYLIKAEIPGVKKDNIKVMIDRNMVSIVAETEKEKEIKDGETVIRNERYYGHQSRSFTLSNEIDDRKASAKYHDGVLELTLPKKESGNGMKHLPIN